LQQSYQKISGTASGTPLKHADLRGNRIELLLPLGRGQLAVAQVDGARMRGTIEIGGRKLPFTATRTTEGRAGGWPERQ
jgi:hypothetical protein